MMALPVNRLLGMRWGYQSYMPCKIVPLGILVSSEGKTSLQRDQDHATREPYTSGETCQTDEGG